MLHTWSASYMLAGRGTPDQADARLWAYREPDAFQALMALLCEVSMCVTTASSLSMPPGIRPLHRFGEIAHIPSIRSGCV